jgi:hypothetical protein
MGFGIQFELGDRMSTKTNRRGNFWEVTYKENIDPFTSWELDKSTDLVTETGKTKVQITTKDDGTRALTLRDKEFLTCDINHFSLDDSTLADCRFVDCRFVKSHFTRVKFSKCQFKSCHFFNARFEECQFLDCTFSRISASAEHLVFLDTTIGASAFFESLETNLDALPNGVSREYQEHRFRASKAKIAGGLYRSVRNEPELDPIFDAIKCLEIALKEKDISELRWKTDGRRLVKQEFWSRNVVARVHQATLWIILIAGFLTNWGRSPLRTLWFLFGAVLLFSGIYFLAFEQALAPAMLRALDCTFVFGYTKYSNFPNFYALDYVMFVNAFFGFCWYALLIPALSKRLFR